MRRFGGSLRDLMTRGIAPNDVMRLFTQVLDGVEAAHFMKVVHRDLKPENILYADQALAIADFGIARFTEDQLVTLVETGPADRLANFVYAAPEQRVRRSQVTQTSDIYALGLLLNEMFTGDVPHGTDYRTIDSASRAHGYLDPIVERMIRSDPGARPATIADVKGEIQKYQTEAITLQRLSHIKQTVILAGEVDDPLAFEPPRLINAQYDGQFLVLTLDRPVHNRWVQAFKTMNYRHSVMGAAPVSFIIDQATARCPLGMYHQTENSLQQIVDHFKGWLPLASEHLKQELYQEKRSQEMQRRQELEAQRNHQERMLQLNRGLRV